MIEHIPPRQPLTTYYVIFTQGTTHWVTRWLKKDFSHIYLLTHDEFNWLLLNPTRLYLQPMILPVPIDESPLTHLMKPTDSVLRVTFGHRNDRQQFGCFGLLNCVTWAKYCLGLRIICFTPFELYQRLLNFNSRQMERHGIQSIEQVTYDWSCDAMEQRP